jgi:hypothetical protein
VPILEVGDVLPTVLPTGQISELRDVSQPSERGKCMVGAIRDVKPDPAWW